jgi:hypothetical protein
MKRDVRLVSYHPAVVWIGRNMKELTGVERDYTPVLERGRGCARENQTNMLDVAMSRAECRAHVL